MGTRTMGSQSGSGGSGQQSQVQSLASEYAVSSGLQRQGSITMSSSLSRKTVGEVWQSIQLGKLKDEEAQAMSHERQVSVGEMTLEDFLVKAGVVAEDITKHEDDLIGNAAGVRNVDAPMVGSQDFAQEAHWLHNYKSMSLEQHLQGQHSMIGAYAAILDPVFPDSSTSLGTLSDSQTPRRKQGAPCDAEDKQVEKRQKRMIKNRESAARSRARKQAYTNELQQKVARLEEENERLRREKELDQMRCAAPVPEPKYRLRRTSSALL